MLRTRFYLIRSQLNFGVRPTSTRIMRRFDSAALGKARDTKSIAHRLGADERARSVADGWTRERQSHQ